MADTSLSEFIVVLNKAGGLILYVKCPLCSFPLPFKNCGHPCPLGQDNADEGYEEDLEAFINDLVDCKPVGIIRHCYINGQGTVHIS